MYLQSQLVTQTWSATYQNYLVISDAVTERDGVYTCSVSNARGYSNGATGVGGKWDACISLWDVRLWSSQFSVADYVPDLPVAVTIASHWASDVAISHLLEIVKFKAVVNLLASLYHFCLLYTSDAADE